MLICQHSAVFAQHAFQMERKKASALDPQADKKKKTVQAKAVHVTQNRGEGNPSLEPGQA